MKTRLFVLPLTALAAVLVAVPTTGCSDGKSVPPAHSTRSEISEKAERALLHDVAWVAKANARCRAATDRAKCLQGSDAEVSKVAPRTLGTRANPLEKLLSKELICGIVKGFLSGPQSTNDGPTDQEPNQPTTPATEAGVTDASVPDTSMPIAPATGGNSLYWFYGGPTKPPADSNPAVTTEVVWDLARSQTVVFVNAKPGIAGLTKLDAVTGVARGPDVSVIEAWTGEFVLDAPADTLAATKARVKKVGLDLVSEVDVGFAPPGLPAVPPSFLAGKSGYVAWDAGTEAFAQQYAGAGPTIIGNPGTKIIQWPNGRNAAAAMTLVDGDRKGQSETSDGSDSFSGPSGPAALTTIAANVAKGLQTTLDTVCEGAALPGETPGKNGVLNKGIGSCVPFQTVNGSVCGGGHCGWNGAPDNYCCRPAPTGTELCDTDRTCEAKHGTGWVCTNRNNLITGGRVCAPRATCK